MAFNDDLADALIVHAIDVAAVANALSNELLIFLSELREEVSRIIDQADISGVTAQARLSRAVAIRPVIEDAVSQALGSAALGLTAGLIELGKIEIGALADVMNAVFNAQIVQFGLTPFDIEVLITNLAITDSPARVWWAKQSSNITQSFMTQLRLGIALGEDNTQIIRRIRGSPTGKRRTVTVNGRRRTVREFTGGILEMSRSALDALVRTATMTVSNEVLKRTYEANSDVLDGWQWQATLDFRTCPRCQALSGGAWNLKTGKPLPDSPYRGRFPGRPALHYNCRCVLTPVVKKWSELLGLNIPELDQVPESTQASMDGQVPASLTYETWLKTKSPEFQKRVLGGEYRYRLWKSGEVKLQGFVSRDLKPLTLKQLRAKYD